VRTLRKQSRNLYDLQQLINQTMQELYPTQVAEMQKEVLARDLLQHGHVSYLIAKETPQRATDLGADDSDSDSDDSDDETDEKKADDENYVLWDSQPFV
jgi:hypothetical protein